MNTAAAPMLELRDIHAAPAPGWWPPAPGWWVLAILLAVLLVLGMLWLRRRYQRRRFRRQGILEHGAGICSSSSFASRLKRRPW